MTTERVGGAGGTRFRLDIQGLRAIAVGAVVLYHAGIPFLPGGYVGVDVFFVISGFLITSHLLRNLDRDGRVRFASFYAKRARRILPASLLVLLLSVVAASIFYPPLLMREVWLGALATAFYVPNLLFATQGTNYLAERTPSLFQHYWSLGIEEQFYLLWPVVLTISFALARSRRALFGVVVSMVAVSFVACVYLTFESQPWAFFSLPTRAWELGVGGIAAFVLRYRPTLLTGYVASVVGWTGVAAIVASSVFFTDETPFPSYWAAIPVLATAAVIVAGEVPQSGGPHVVLSLPSMQFIGRISYSLYLVHWPILLVPQAAVGFENLLPQWTTFGLGALSIPIAWLMYRYVEEPARTAPWLANSRPRRSLFAAGAASVMLALVATGIYAYLDVKPLRMSQVAPALVAQAPPPVTTYVPSNITPSLLDVSNDQPEIYEGGCHLDFNEVRPRECVFGDPSAPRIVLFGDSHAAQWFPALKTYALTAGYSLQTLTKSACPAVDVRVVRAGVQYVECDEWRRAAITAINQAQPVMVVTSNFAESEFVASTPVEWGDGLSKTLSQIEAPTVVVQDTPHMGVSPAICLSNHLDRATDCARPRALALSQSVIDAEQRAADASGASVANLNDFICSSELCNPVLGDTLVYRDEHHLTATFSERLSTPLGAAIQKAIAGLNSGN